MPRKLHVIPRLVLKQARGVNETLQHQVASTLSSRKFSNCLFDISGILVYRILINTDRHFFSKVHECKNLKVYL